MTMFSAFREACEPPSVSRTSAIVSALPGPVRVELADAARFAAVAEDWMSLAARAGVPNAFMDPAVALAVAEAWSHPVRILLAWKDGEPGIAPALVGAWLFVERRTRQSWPYRALVSPPCSVAYLGTPMIDPEHARPVLAAVFAKIRETPSLPGLLQAGDLSDNCILMEAVKSALRHGRGSMALIERRTRAKLDTRLDPKTYWTNSMSEHRHRLLARSRRQLEKRGRLEFTSVGDPAAVAAGIEEFLALEASGWKGARRSALACDPALTLFTREMAAGLAARRLIAVQSLRLDDVPIAMGIVLYSGSAAFTWRVAYDENYRRFSPGILFLGHATAHLLSDSRVRSTDSCNHLDIGFQADRWAERHDVIDVLIDLGSTRPLRLALLSWRERLFRRCKAVLRQAYHFARRSEAQLTSQLQRRPGGSGGRK